MSELKRICAGIYYPDDNEKAKGLTEPTLCDVLYIKGNFAKIQFSAKGEIIDAEIADPKKFDGVLEILK